MKKLNFTKMMNRCLYFTYFFITTIKIFGVNSYSQCTFNGNKSALDHLQEIPLPMDLAIQDTIKSDESRRYSVILKEFSPLTINMSSCSSPVTWNIFYNKTINFGNYLPENETQISIMCAKPGQYDFLITTENNCKYQIIAEKRQIDENWPYLNRTQTTNTKIRLQNRQQRHQVLVKWEKSKLDIHAMHYCITINTEKQQKSLCEAASMLMLSSSSSSSTLNKNCEQFYMIENLQKMKPERIMKIESNVMSIICTGSKSQQILRGLQLNTPYFIDIFAIHTKLSNFSFLLGSTKTWLNRTHPIPLQEDKTVTGKLSDLGGVSVFSYKVPMKSSSLRNVRLIVIPCGGSVDVRIMKQKHKILLKKNIFKPTWITISNTNPGDRYIIRVTPSTDDDFLTINKVEMTITSKEQFNHLPELPKNMSIIEFSSTRSCRSTTIAWFTSNDTRKIRYCVYVIKLLVKNREFDNIKTANYCEINEELMEHPQLQQINCFYPKKRPEIETLRLVGLSSRSHYFVHITASLSNGKQIPYESVRVKTLIDCPRNYNKKQQNQQLITIRNNTGTKFKDVNSIYSDYSNSRT